MSNVCFAPSRIINIDETGFSTVHRPQTVLAPKRQKQVGGATSGERRKLTTDVCCVTATGHFLPPMFIFARKRSATGLGFEAPDGSKIEISYNGWITDLLFLKFLKHVVSYMHPELKGQLPTAGTILDPVLLVMDNHESHCTLEVIDYCKIHNIHVVTLPPHSSQKTQPLDTTFYGSLKKIFDIECDNFMKPKFFMRRS